MTAQKHLDLAAEIRRSRAAQLGGPITNDWLKDLLEQVVRERDAANGVQGEEWRYSDQEPLAAEAALAALCVLRDRYGPSSPDWAPLAKALFEIERNPDIKDQAWFDFQSKAQRIIAIMSEQKP